jgi:hypothetical protein
LQDLGGAKAQSLIASVNFVLAVGMLDQTAGCFASQNIKRKK